MADSEIQVVQISVNDWVELVTTMKRLETKLDAALNDISDHENRIREVEKVKDPTGTFKNHENRINALEKWRWRNTGFASAIGAGMTIVVNYIIYRK